MWLTLVLAFDRKVEHQRGLSQCGCIKSARLVSVVGSVHIVLKTDHGQARAGAKEFAGNVSLSVGKAPRLLAH